MIMMKPAAGTEHKRPQPETRRPTESPRHQPFVTSEAEQAEAKRAAEAAQAEREKKEAADAAQLFDLRQDMMRKFGREFSLEPQQEQIDDYAIVKKEFFRRSGIFQIEIKNSPSQTDQEAQFSVTFRTLNPLTAEQLVADATAKIHKTIRAYRSFPKEEKAKAVALAVYTDIISFLKNKHANQLALMPDQE